MLLRRVSEHVKEQNWFAVLVDFVIVIAGVFIGIQVANWNEARGLSEQSIDFTQRLQADIQEEAWDYQYMIEYHRDVKQNAMRAISVLEGDVTLSDEELVIAAYRATQINVITRRRATFDELVSTGKLHLISDELLLKTAIGIYDFGIYDTIYDSGYHSKYREQFRMKINSAVQLALGESCGDKMVEPLDYAGIVNSLDYPCELQVSQELLAEAATTIKEDGELLSFLRLRLAQLQSSLFSLENYYPEISETLKQFR